MTNFPSPALVAELMAQVALAEAAFRSRWRLQTLARVDPELHGLLVEQIGLYDSALVRGSDEDAKTQADAMVRGWRAAVSALESPLRSDDAYLVGFDGQTGIAVVIAEQAGSAARCQVRDGQKVITVTPDEVAKIVAGLSVVMEAKGLFPDAEVVRFAAHQDGDDAEAVMRDHALKVAKI
jgi:hypothetical protein